MDTLRITYSYSTSDERKLEPLLVELEQELGGERRPYYMRAGALDLVTVLELVVSVTVAVPVSKYFEGLFLGDKAQSLGQKHREQILGWFSRLSSEIEHVVQVGQLLLKSRFVDVSLSIGGDGAIAIVVPIDSVYLYAVLNHTGISKEVEHNLSKGLINAIKFLLTHPVPEDSIVLQLYFDKISKRWKYLLVPTPQMFGRWIDRYIDLDTEQVQFVRSREQFFEIFRPESHDEYKFLISPFREDW